MRYLHKSWQDRRPGWTRRVRWYAPGEHGETIRLRFEDTDGEASRFYRTARDAQSDYDCFRVGVLRVADILTTGHQEATGPR